MNLKNIIYLLFLFYTPILFGQKKVFPKSKIIDTVFVNDDLKESYALYVPKNYDSTKPSPIIFIFDPGARGKNGISRFVKASEKYNYLLVCSNNSKNGPYHINFEIINRLFAKVFSDFNINSKRIYAAGFSGGSRLSSAVAVLTGQIQGIIACGAGLSKNKSHLPSNDNFSYAGIIGDEDMNYKEMYNTKDFLNRLNISNELFVYEFAHSWPNEEQILRAADWLQLEAYRKKLIEIDTTVIADIYTNYNSHAVELKKTNQLLKASFELERITTNFNNSFNLDSISTSLTNIKKNKLYSKQKKSLISNFKKEVILSDKFIDKFNTDFKTNTSNIKWWRNEIAKLKKKISNSKSIDEKKMLKRVEYKIFALAVETTSYGGKISNINQSIFCYDICLLIYPKYYFLYFRQIENYINKNLPETALDYLEKLVESGYENKNYIKNYSAFQSLKGNPKFIELTKN